MIWAQTWILSTSELKNTELISSLMKPAGFIKKKRLIRRKLLLAGQRENISGITGWLHVFYP